jgi:hypothetical protein
MLKITSSFNLTWILFLCFANANAALVTPFGAQVRGNDLVTGKNDEVGGVGFTFADVDNLPEYKAEAGLGGSSFTPLLKALASNPNSINPDDRTSSTAEAYQRFQNTSGSQLDVTLTISLDADFTSTGPGADSYALADVYVYGGSAFEIIDSPICGNGRLGQSMMLGDAYLCGQRFDRANMFLEADPTQPTSSGSLVRDLLFSIAPGEFIGVYGILRANAVDGSSDAFNTLSMAFDDISQANLQAASIPVPAAAWLFGSGLLGLISIARRKKS